MPKPRKDPSLIGKSDSIQKSEGYRAIPWFILGDPNIRSHGVALVLSTIWFALQDRTGRIDTQRRLTNRIIAQRSGIKNLRTVERYLTQLEILGYIQRIGNTNNRTIVLTWSPPSQINPKNIIINPTLLESKLSPTQKLFIALKGTSKKVICKTLRISERTYYRVKALTVNFDSSVSVKTDSGYRQICHYSNIKAERTSKENKPVGNSKELQEEDFPLKSSQGGFSESPKEDYMLQRYIRPETAKQRQIDNTPLEKLIRPETLLELTEEVFQYEHIRTNQKKNTLKEAARVVEALKKPGGLANLFKKDEIDYIVATMSKNYKFPERDIRAVLHHQFDEEARVNLYEALDKSMSLLYGGSGKKISLQAAAASQAPGSMEPVRSLRIPMDRYFAGRPIFSCSSGSTLAITMPIVSPKAVPTNSVMPGC